MQDMLFSFRLLMIMVGGMGFFEVQADALGIGDAAPAFELKDQEGKAHRLGDYRGRWVVLYFYPKDNTPGCTTEACHFRDDILDLKALDAQVLGVSLDDTASHAAFAKKHGLPFPLLSDPHGEVAQRYGALGGFGPVRYAKRHSFIIDPEGRIAKVYRKVSPKAHSAQVIEDVEALRSAF